MNVLKNTRRRRARRPLAALMSLLVLAGLMAVVFVVPATGAEGDELLPDLQADSVGEVDSTATYTDAGGSHLLLRFSSYIRNVGPGPLEITGVNPVNRRITGDGLRQVISHADLTKTEEPRPGAELRYEETDGHNHWHFQNAARYSLWNNAKTQEVGFSSKVGFCFLDIGSGDPNYNPLLDSPNNFQYTGTVAPRVGTPPQPPFPSSTNNCLAGAPVFPDAADVVQPPRTKIDMGISTGWRDVYEKTLPFQYVDVSDVIPGFYWVRSQVDPLNLIRESNENNPAAFSTVRATVPGYIAGAVNAGQISGVKASTSTITLKSTKFANALDPAIGAVRYRVTEQPEHGTLAPATGTTDGDGWFAASQVVYTKDPGYNGPDTFKYAAKQAGSQFPLSPTSASVTMQVGSGNGSTVVGITGAPAQLYTVAGIKLSAAVVPSGPVTWRVNDVVGGNASVGTIDSSGYYRAPASVPAAGNRVRITATSDDGTFDAVEITIVARPVVKPKPDLPDPPVITPPKTPTVAPALSKPTIGRVGRRLIVKYMPGKSGKLTVNVSRKGKRLAGCKVTVQKGRSLTCRFVLKKSKVKKLTGSLTVSAKLTSKGRTLASRRTTVSLKVTAKTTRIGPLCILTPVKR